MVTDICSLKESKEPIKMCSCQVTPHKQSYVTLRMFTTIYLHRFVKRISFSMLYVLENVQIVVARVAVIWKVGIIASLNTYFNQISFSN